MSDPFAAHTVSLGLYTDPDQPWTMLEHLFVQAQAAETSGLDGVTISEHHAGFAPYVPNPLQVAGWILDRTETIWAGPCPLLLPLRPAALVAEELSWLAALHPGRVGAGVAPGYAMSDFEVYGVPFEDRAAIFADALGFLGPALRGATDSTLDDDRAVAGNQTHPIPLVVAAGSATAARRAAAARAGIITDSMATPDRLATLFETYTEAGGDGPRVVNRRVWVGEPPTELFERQAARYRDAAGAGSWLDGAGVNLVHGDAVTVGSTLSDLCRVVGATHLGLKVHVEGVTQGQVLEQIARLGEVLPAIWSSERA